MRLHWWVGWKSIIVSATNGKFKKRGKEGHINPKLIWSRMSKSGCAVPEKKASEIRFLNPGQLN